MGIREEEEEGAGAGAAAEEHGLQHIERQDFQFEVQ